eukprot:9501280-Pyramimonas_sp.AAC.1
MSEGTNNVPKMEFDCRPGDHEVALAPREPMYQETATYCHFGREPYPKDGKKYFEWESPGKARSMPRRARRRPLQH